jgi:preprotein translocase subunit SecD
MKIHWLGFNIYLLAVLALICGCRSPEHKREHALSTLRVHMEMDADNSGHAHPVPVFRDKPFMVNIEHSPILTEADVSEARVVQVVGGWALRVQFDRHGSWVLEQYSMSNRGKHLVIFSQFASPDTDGVNPGRWLAAPVISGRITDGAILFTADASVSEGYQIALGLNNAAKKHQIEPSEKKW